MRVNIYAEELADRVDLITKEVEGREFTAVRFWLELPVTLPAGCRLSNGAEVYQAKGPFMHRPGDDDSSAVTFWGKRELIPLLEKALDLLRAHYAQTCEHVYSYAVHPAGKCVKCGAHD
jgi:hypothetical protein